MNTIEARLSGPHADLEGILKFVNRHLMRGPFSRVEVRYSTQTRRPLLPDPTRQHLVQLLREHGMQPEVSVRRHGGLLDDATGEHLVRLLPPEPDERTRREDDSTSLRTPAGWWERTLVRVGLRRPAAAEPNTPDAGTAVSAAQAVAALREAVALTARTQAQLGRRGPWLRAEVVVRMRELDAALAPMIQGDLAAAAQTLAGLLAAQGHRADAGLAVRYRFELAARGDGTSFSSATDLEVALFTSAGVSNNASPTDAHGRVEPTLMPRGTSVPEATHASDAATLLPTRARAPRLRVQLVGTTAGDFAAPLTLEFDELPARIDRDALSKMLPAAAAARPAHHDELAAHLATVSNRAPLIVCADASGQLVLQPAGRSTDGGRELPMHFDRNTLAPLVSGLPLRAEGQTIVLNDPDGVMDADGKRRLPALVLRVMPI